MDGDIEIDGKTLIREIQRAVLRLFGEYGASKTKTQLIEYDKITKQAIIRCNHRSLPKLRAAIATITKIDEKPAALHIKTVSGTIKTLKRKTKTYKNPKNKS